MHHQKKTCLLVIKSQRKKKTRCSNKLVVRVVLRRTDIMVVFGAIAIFLVSKIIIFCN